MKIAVLRGGPSAKYDTSLKTGEFILSFLRKDPEKYEVKDIFISKDGEWHLAGRKFDPHIALSGTDLVWNALQGDRGEDGEVGQLLNNLHIPHTGSSTLGLALALNADLAKQVYLTHDLPTPRYQVLEGTVALDDLRQIFQTFLHPVIVKPVHGREVDVTVQVHTFDELKAAVSDAFRHATRVMVEEFVRGVDVACGVIEGLRGEKLYSLLPIPNKFKPEEHKMIEHFARRAHEVLNLRHYSVSNFIITPKGKIYIIGTNPLPDMTKASPFMRSLPSVGLSSKEFVDHIVSMTHKH